MQVSLMGRELVKKFEGLHKVMADGRVRSYRCPAGKWTIGWGHTKGVKSGMHCTVAQAEAFLQADLDDAAKAVERHVKVSLTQNQFDAITSFVFNLGEENFRTSTLLKRLNARNFGDVPAQLARWNKATVEVNGRRVKQVVPGLTRRRAAEAALFTMDAPLASAEGAAPMPQKIMASSVERPLTKSRTLAGAGLAAISLALSEVTQQLQPLVGMSEHIQSLFLFLTVAGIGLSAYARIDGYRKGDI